MKANRFSRQADKLQKRLAWQASVLNGDGNKRKGLHWASFARLKDEHDPLAQISFQDVGCKFGLRTSISSPESVSQNGKFRCLDLPATNQARQPNNRCNFLMSVSIDKNQLGVKNSTTSRDGLTPAPTCLRGKVVQRCGSPAWRATKPDAASARHRAGFFVSDVNGMVYRRRCATDRVDLSCLPTPQSRNG